ncbi:MAG TPA: trypsin-like peptidase domain-containing protein [Bryobacteraceae bacterium]|nr:trypsin-like peptidase domain-containing protein [Bryobacteraceae bacterium]
MRVPFFVAVITVVTALGIAPVEAQQADTVTGVPVRGGLVSLHDLSGSLESLVARVRPAVVQIFTTGYGMVDDDESGNTSNLISKQRATGSGVILSADGYIVTNSHVVLGARRIQVKLEGETVGPNAARRSMEAKVVGMDRETDLAVLKIARTGLPHLALGDSAALKQGQLVMAFGNPLGLEGSVTMGVVSSTSRQLKPDDWMTYIQTDAPINPGNSGGPLVDSDAHVVGLNTFILTQSGGSEGIGFAVPSNIVNDTFNQIRKNGHVHHGQLGIYAQTITPAMARGLKLPRDWGVVVADVAPGGPADKAGIKIGDILATANGKTLEAVRQLELVVYRHPINEKITLEIIRGAQTLTIDTPVIEREDDPMRFADMVDPDKNVIRRLGILGVEINEQLAALLPDLRREYGIVVAATLANSPNGESALQIGDVIYAANQVPAVSVDALRSTLNTLKSGDAVVLQIERDGRLMFITVELE